MLAKSQDWKLDHQMKFTHITDFQSRNSLKQDLRVHADRSATSANIRSAKNINKLIIPTLIQLIFPPYCLAKNFCSTRAVWTGSSTPPEQSAETARSMSAASLTSIGVVSMLNEPQPPAASASALSARVAGSPPRRSPRNSERPGPHRSPRHCGAPAGNG